MSDRPAPWVAALICCTVVAGQGLAQAAAAPATPAPAAAATEAAPAPAQAVLKDVPPGRSADAEPRRRLKFKGRAANCLCADPITDEEIDAAAARQREGQTQTPNPRSKP